MTEAEVVQITRHHLEGQFPKACAACGRSYCSFRDWLLHTTPVGSTVSYDAALGDWNPLHPIGTVTLANCPCGNTMALSSEGLSLFQLWRCMNWARSETKKRGLTLEQLLNHLRQEIRNQVLSEPEPGSA